MGRSWQMLKFPNRSTAASATSTEWLLRQFAASFPPDRFPRMRIPTSSATSPLLALTTLCCLLGTSRLLAQASGQPAAAPSAEQPAQKAPPAAAAPAKQRVPFLKPNGSFQDLAELGFDPMSLLGGGGSPPKPFYPFLESLEGLAKVEEPQVMLDLTGALGFNLPQLREIERSIAKVRAAGKRIVCYLENGSPVAYQMAVLCDEVWMADMGALDLRSPAMSVMHLKDALDLLGVQVEVTRVGAFKGAVEPYMLPEMSSHLRKHYEAMLQSMNQDLVRRIASGRKLEASRVRELQGQRLLRADEALAAGLVDKLVPWSGPQRAMAVVRGDEAFELVDAAPKKKAQNRDFMTILGNMFKQQKEEEIDYPMIAVMHLAGEIVDGDKAAPGSMVSGPVVKKLDELTSNKFVKGVVVRINSPGGSATASEAIRQALQRLAAAKPVVFSMGELAASGGYWITTIGEPILAETTTITGSIGVFGMRFQVGALMRRLGVHTAVVNLDEGPLMDAMDRPWSDDARARMQSFVDDIYGRFLAQVATSRKKTVQQIEPLAGGRVWSGQQALEHGLVDAIGGVDDAIAMIRQRANIEGKVDIEHLPEPKNFGDSLFSSLFESQVATEVAGLRGLLLAARGYNEVLRVLRDALQGDGRMRIYAQLPAGLRVR